MTFSIIAKGSRADVLRSLGYQQVSGPLGAAVLLTVTDAIGAGPDKMNGRDVIYNVSASGHADLLGESAPYLSVSVTAELLDAKPADGLPDMAGQAGPLYAESPSAPAPAEDGHAFPAY